VTDWAQDCGLWGLFTSAFISSTIAPGGSEAVIAYLADGGQFGTPTLLWVATLGNTLGAMTTWGLGFLLAKGTLGKDGLELQHGRSIDRLRRWGWPVLLLSWLPLIGDGFCFAAGWLRWPFWASAMVIAAGKCARYAAILLTWKAVAGATS
jgi:membrane protein YqaA with SNARE-associated domain